MKRFGTMLLDALLLQVRQNFRVVLLLDFRVVEYLLDLKAYNPLDNHFVFCFLFLKIKPLNTYFHLYLSYYLLFENVLKIKSNFEEKKKGGF